MERQPTEPIFNEEEYQNLLENNPDLMNLQEGMSFNLSDSGVIDDSKTDKLREIIRRNVENSNQSRLIIPSQNEIYMPQQMMQPSHIKEETAHQIGSIIPHSAASSTNGLVIMPVRGNTPENLLQGVSMSMIQPDANYSNVQGNFGYLEESSNQPAQSYSNSIVYSNDYHNQTQVYNGTVRQATNYASNIQVSRSGNSYSMHQGGGNEYNIRAVQQQQQLLTQPITNNPMDINNMAVQNGQQPITDGNETVMSAIFDLISTDEDNGCYYQNNEMVKNEFSVPRSRFLDVSSLKNWPGNYGFSVMLAVPPDDSRQKNKVCYSDKLDQMYCLPETAVEIHVNALDWNFLGEAKLGVFLVFRESSHRMTPVNRCPTCPKNSKNEEEKVKNHIVRLSNSNAVYSEIEGRKITSIPIKRPTLGEQSVPIFMSYGCMTSCSGGPNRKAFDTVFSLIVGGKEVGRHIIHSKVCKAPSRDKKNEEGCGAKVEPPNNLPRGNSQVATGSGMSGKRKVIKSEKNIVSTFSSDSESEKAKNSKRKKMENGIPANYTSLVFPEKYKAKVVEYIKGLTAIDKLSKTDPNFYGKSSYN